jgi:hypothetical protein
MALNKMIGKTLLMKKQELLRVIKLLLDLLKTPLIIRDTYLCGAYGHHNTQN